MISRFFVAITMALLGFVATAGIAAAARGPDATDVMVGTGVAILAMMAVLFSIYLFKVVTGIEKPLPPEEPGAGHH
jgi:hypothetical protein